MVEKMDTEKLAYRTNISISHRSNFQPEMDLKKIGNEIRRINLDQNIRNYDSYGPLTDDAVVIVIQVISYFTYTFETNLS